MKTTTIKTTTRGINLGVIPSISSSPVYVTTRGIRIGSRGPVLEASTVYSQISKELARSLRKALHRAGYRALAAMPRGN